MSSPKETLSFLRRILPAQGPYSPYSKGIQPKIPLQTIEEVAQWAARRKTDVYVGLASFTGRRGGGFRTSRSFWADVDVGSGKLYPCQFSALQAINLAVGAGLPPPSINSSGNGLHLLWTLTEEMDEPTWRNRSAALRNKLSEAGLSVDAQRTTDPSNGPRIPGTVNGKSGDLVRLSRRAAPVWTGAAWDAAVSARGDGPERRHSVLGVPGPVEKRIAAKTPFIHDYGNAEYDADGIAAQCAQMQALRDGAELDEPSWNFLFGVLAACANGEQRAHEWSSRDPRYDEAETQGRLDRIRERGYKPTTCEWFRANGQGRCEGCTLSCHSPISLGRSAIARPDPVELPAVENAETPTEVVVGRHAPKLPEGYATRGKFIIKERPDGAGWFNVCQIVYCVGRSQEGLSQSYSWLVYSGDGSRLENFNLPASDCNAKAKPFTDRVLVMSDAGADAYVRAAKAMIMEEQNAEEVRKSFGWNDTKTAFLLGDILHRSGGATKKINSLGPAAEELAPAYTAAGDEATWQKAMMQILKPGQEAASFLTLLSAGAPLHSLMTDEGGTVVVLRSHGSGHGKTTALAAAMSIWGRWKDLGNWSNNTKISNSGKWETVGNLPIPWDEAHVEKDDELKGRVLAFSDGQARVRTGRDGTQKAVGRAWSTFLVCTSNSDLRRRLGTMVGATEGPVARVLQLETQLDKESVQEDGGALLNAFSRHYGHAGQKLIGAMLTKPEMLPALEAELLGRNQERMKRLGLPNSARFACRAITCAEVGGNLLRLVALPDLDVGRIIHAVERMLVATVATDQEQARSQDLVQEFIRQKNGELILVGPNMEQASLRRITARFEQDRTGARLFVPVGTWSKWIASYNKSDLEAERDAVSLGYIVRRETLDLAKGTGYPGQTKTRCVVVVLDAVAAKDASDEVSKVVPIARPAVVPKGKK